jgi:hypothetical protein
MASGQAHSLQFVVTGWWADDHPMVRSGELTRGSRSTVVRSSFDEAERVAARMLELGMARVHTHVGRHRKQVVGR